MHCMLIGSVTDRVLHHSGIPCSLTEDDRLGHAMLHTVAAVSGQAEAEPEIQQRNFQNKGLHALVGSRVCKLTALCAARRWLDSSVRVLRCGANQRIDMLAGE